MFHLDHLKTVGGVGIQHFNNSLSTTRQTVSWLQ